MKVYVVYWSEQDKVFRVIVNLDTTFTAISDWRGVFPNELDARDYCLQLNLR